MGKSQNPRARKGFIDRHKPVPMKDCPSCRDREPERSRCKVCRGEGKVRR
jgi:hypothetical protein